jgi:glyoxylase-like metal-dependent hydrolase (beta-lactamase superfamily II)
VLTDAQLGALGVRRLPLPIPFAQAGGPVNAYLVELADGGYCLVDTGVDSPEGHAALLEGLGPLRGELRQIVVTHGHVDHFGAARFLQERHGGALPVLASAVDAPRISADGPSWRDERPVFDAHFVRLGVSAEALEEMSSSGERTFSFGPRAGQVTTLAAGAELRGRRTRFEVLPMPGHTPGLVCLYDRELGILISGDHLLEQVSPNPLVDLGPDGTPDSWRPLVAYLDSIARTRALEVDVVLPGHGPPFAHHRQVIDTLTRFYDKRQRRIVERLGEARLTGLEVTRMLFPWTTPRDYFLTISETVANLQAMVLAGTLVRDDEGPVWRYRRA